MNLRNQMQERGGQRTSWKHLSFPYGIGMYGMNKWQTSEADLGGMLITFIILTPHTSLMSPWQSGPGVNDKGFIWLGNDSFWVLQLHTQRYIVYDGLFLWKSASGIGAIAYICTWSIFSWSLSSDTDDNSCLTRQLCAWTLFPETVKPSLIIRIGETEVW